jgi:hypothetical protein
MSIHGIIGPYISTSQNNLNQIPQAHIQQPLIMEQQEKNVHFEEKQTIASINRKSNSYIENPTGFPTLSLPIIETDAERVFDTNQVYSLSSATSSDRSGSPQRKENQFESIYSHVKIEKTNNFHQTYNDNIDHNPIYMNTPIFSTSPNPIRVDHKQASSWHDNFA